MNSQFSKVFSYPTLVLHISVFLYARLSPSSFRNRAAPKSTTTSPNRRRRPIITARHLRRRQRALTRPALDCDEANQRAEPLRLWCIHHAAQRFCRPVEPLPVSTGELHKTGRDPAGDLGVRIHALLMMESFLVLYFQRRNFRSLSILHQRCQCRVRRYLFKASMMPCKGIWSVNILGPRMATQKRSQTCQQHCSTWACCVPVNTEHRCRAPCCRCVTTLVEPPPPQRVALLIPSALMHQTSQRVTPAAGTPAWEVGICLYCT
jgi:hypothetical protein